MEDKDFTIENRIRELRREKKLSQEDLAEALGISRQSIISIETGRTTPSLPLAVAMCQFFDSAFEEMFEFGQEIEREIDNAFANNNIKINSGRSAENTADQSERKEHTMELQPWRPFRESISLHDAMDRLLEDSFIAPSRLTGGMPKINIRDLGTSILIEAELPGIPEEDINVEILDDVMTISGEKKEQKEEKDEKKGYFYKESHSGAFSRSFTLPSDVIADKATADMKNGVLSVVVPKVEPKKAKKIEVKKKKLA